MLFIIGSIILAAAAIAAGWWLAGLPGTIAFSLGNFSIETSSAIALVAMVVLLVLVVIVLRILGWVLGTGTRTGRWRRRRRRTGGDQAVTGALLALAAGDRDRAQRDSAQARRLLGDTPQTLLLAAQAARLAGQEAVAADLYRKLSERPDAALLGWRGLLRQAAAREDWAEAAAIAGRGEAAYPGSPWLREERGRLAARAGDWREALALAAPDAPRAAFAVAAAEAASEPHDGLKLAKQAWKAKPEFAPAALAYARRLQQRGRDSKALDILRLTWTRAPQPDLAAMALSSAADPAERIRRAGRLISGKPDHPESLLLLARLNLQAGNAAAARRQVEAARRAGLDDRRVWVLLADLEGREGTAETHRLAQRDALRRAAEAPSEPAWRCEACGTVLPEWRPTCPHCHNSGQVAWSAATRVELLPPVR